MSSVKVRYSDFRDAVTEELPKDDPHSIIMEKLDIIVPRPGTTIKFCLDKSKKQPPFFLQQPDLNFIEENSVCEEKKEAVDEAKSTVVDKVENSVFLKPLPKSPVPGEQPTQALSGGDVKTTNVYVAPSKTKLNKVIKFRERILRCKTRRSHYYKHRKSNKELYNNPVELLKQKKKEALEQQVVLTVLQHQCTHLHKMNIKMQANLEKDLDVLRNSNRSVEELSNSVKKMTLERAALEAGSRSVQDKACDTEADFIYPSCSTDETSSGSEDEGGSSGMQKPTRRLYY